MKKIVLAIFIIGMMVSCIEEKSKIVIARNINGDTITLHKVQVEKEFRVGDVVFPNNRLNRMKIVRECR